MVNASEPYSRGRTEQCTPYLLLLRDTQVLRRALALIFYIRPMEFQALGNTAGIYGQWMAGNGAGEK